MHGACGLWRSLTDPEGHRWRAEHFPAPGALEGAELPVSPLRLGHRRDGTLRATPLADPSCGEGGGGQGSAGGCLASRGRPQLHWSARGCAGLGVCDEVGGARAHLEVPWVGRSRDTHSGQSVSLHFSGPEGADSVHPSRWGRRRGVEWWMGLPVRSLARGAHVFGRGGPGLGGGG